MTDDMRQPTEPLPAVPEVPTAPYARDETPRPTRSARIGSEERDHSLLHHGRKRREQRQSRRKRQQTAMTVAGAVLLGVAVIGFGIFLWVSAASNAPKDVAGESSSKGGFISQALARTSKGLDEGVKKSAPKEPDPLPYLAKYHGLRIRTPIEPEKLTEIGFHQAARDYALHLTPFPKKAQTEKIRKTKTTGEHPVIGDGGDAKLGGFYIPMWRNRPGAPDSAIDVGAAPGTAVYAPVDGEVVRVRHYKLYGKLTDWEMHIRPDDASNIDVVVIHIANPTVEIGQHVVGGKTKIAEVRHISGVIDSQLADFSHGGGNHVHIQLNDTTRGDYKGLRLPDDAGLDAYPGPVAP